MAIVTERAYRPIVAEGASADHQPFEKVKFCRIFAEKRGDIAPNAGVKSWHEQTHSAHRHHHHCLTGSGQICNQPPVAKPEASVSTKQEKLMTDHRRLAGVG